MVQILPQKTNLGSLIGQSAGQGLQSGLSQAMQQQFQRGNLQEALGKVKGLAANEDSSPLDVLLGLMEAGAGIPGSEKYIGQLAPLLQSMMAGKKANQTPPPPGGGIGSEPVGVQGQPQQQQQSIQNNTNDPKAFVQNAKEQYGVDLPEPSFTPDLFQGNLEPTRLGLGPIAPTYLPEEFQRIEKEDAPIYGVGKSPRIQLMNDFNEKSRLRNEDIVRGATQHAQLGEMTKRRQEERREALDSQLGFNEKTPRDVRAVADLIGEWPEYKNINNDHIRAERIGKALDTYKANKNAFDKGASRPNPVAFHAKYKNALKNIKNNAQTMIDYGQRNEVQRTLADNGWSESEIAHILNPLPQNVTQEIKSLPHYSQTRLVNNPELKIKTDQRISDSLAKSIKPGEFNPKKPGVFDPGTSLVLLRNQFMKKGVSSDEFNNLLNRAIEQKGIKLDPYQANELNMMSNEPWRTSSIYEIIFGTE